MERILCEVWYIGSENDEQRISDIWGVSAKTKRDESGCQLSLEQSGLDIFVNISYIDSFIGVDKIYRQGQE